MVAKEYSEHAKQATELLLRSVNREMNLIYGELAAKLEPSVDPHTQLNWILGDVADLCFSLGLPLLSAKVVAKNTKEPGKGFYDMYCQYYPEGKSLDAAFVWRRELERIRLCDDWVILADFLGIEVEIPTSPKVSQQVYPDESNLPEGARKTVLVNTYERKPGARQRCIAEHGSKCVICDFDAASVYGNDFVGKIHVHHTIPLAEIRQEYMLNPENDLRPVCPNCHMILHSKKNGVYTIEEVRKMLSQSK